VRFRDDEQSDISIHHANILMVSTLSFFVGRRSKEKRYKDTEYYDTQKVARWEHMYFPIFLDMFANVKGGERVIDLNYLLGVYYRLYPHYKEHHDHMWNAFLKRYQEMSIAKQKSMLFFMEKVIVANHTTCMPSMMHLEAFMKQLCLQMHATDHTLRKHVLSLLRAFSKIQSLEALISKVVLDDDFVHFFYNHETHSLGPFLDLSTTQQAMILSLFPSIPGRFSSTWIRAFQVLSQNETFSSSQGFLMLLETIRIKYLQDESRMIDDDDESKAFIKALLIFLLSALIHLPVTRQQEEWLLVRELVLLYKTAGKAHPKLIQLFRNQLYHVEQQKPIHQMTHISRFIRILLLHPQRSLLKKDLIWIVLQCHLCATNEKDLMRDRLIGIDHVYYLNALMHSHPSMFERVMKHERLSLSALFFLSRQLPLRALFQQHQQLIEDLLNRHF